MASDPSELLDPSINGWDEGVARLRNDTKWVLGILGVGATALLGAGPLVAVTNKSWAKDWQGLLIAAGLLLAGIACTTYLLRSVARVFRPVVVSLAELPEATSRRLAKNEESRPPYLSKAPLADQLAFANAVAFTVRQEAGESGIDPKTGKLHPAWARAVADTDAYRAAMEGYCADVLSMARYDAVAEKRKLGRWPVRAGVLALLLGIGVVAALSIDFTPAAISTGALAKLTVSDPNHVPNAWTGNKLDDCAPPGMARKLLFVTVVSGTGKPAEPYVVRTIPELAADPAKCAEMDLLPTNLDLKPVLSS